LWENQLVLHGVVLFAALLAQSADPGMQHFDERRFAAAEQHFRKALSRNPRDARARLYLARTLIETGRTPEALAEVERALGSPVAPEVRFEAGRLLRELAERRFAGLQQIAPNSAPTLELAGARFERAGDLEAALKQYVAAASLEPNRPGIHYRIGNVLWNKRELESAAEALRREIALTPHHGMANLRIGQVLLNGERAGEALPYLERAVAAMPQSIEVRREIGKAYRKAGRTAEARAAWEAVAKARPGDDQIHYLLGTLYRELGEPDLAKRELEVHRDILQRRRARTEQR
jgi:cellulose synthase operon protein C